MTEGADAGPAPVVGQPPRPKVRRPWPELPRWFWLGLVVTVALFVVLGAVAISLILDEETQPLFARRSASRVGEQSHDVGSVVVSTEPPTPVRCGVLNGLQVAGDSVVEPLLRDAVENGLCGRLPNLELVVAERVAEAAKRGVVISFGIFERTGEDSTTLAGSPPRVVLNTRFAGAFKGFLLPLLVHELFHAGSTEVTAVDELAARRAEVAMCALVPSSTVSRSCTDARAIIAVPEADALRQLRDQGFR